MEQNTFFDELIKAQKDKGKNKKTKIEILIYYKSTQNKKSRKYIIENNYLSPYLSDIKSFLNDIKIKLKKNYIKNIDYIRYTLDENHGDNFYRCFIFNLLEKKILKKDKEYIYMII